MSAKEGRVVKSGQDALLAPGDVERPVRRVERAVAASLEAAGLEPVDQALAILAVELGTAADVAATRHDVYGVAAVARELRETLVRLGMDPVSRAGAGSEELRELLNQLGPA